MINLELSDEEAFVRSVAQLKQRFARGDGKAGFMLISAYDPDNDVIPTKWRERIGASIAECEFFCKETFKTLQKAADQGDGEAMHLIGIYYQTGMPPVQQDENAFYQWCERAFAAGYFFAGNDLYSFYSDPDSTFHDKAKAREMLNSIRQHAVRVVR